MTDLTPTEWESVTESDLRTAARVARASGGVVMAGAAAAWELRANMIADACA